MVFLSYGLYGNRPYDDDSSADHAVLSDEDARALLARVGLGELCPGRYSLDAPEEWETVLSGGERQRLAWCARGERASDTRLVNHAF